MTPLPYHRSVADTLEREHPASFGALLPQGSTGRDGLDQALLRSTYRLEPASHPEVHEAVGRAADSVGLAVPVEIHADEGQRVPNAELVFVPDRAILLFTGPTLELLDAAELCAVGAHELAHHQLWTAEGGRYLAAARLLDAAEGDARTPSEYLETARRYRLATELYADRAALRATEVLSTAVSGLLKAATGLRRVDPAAYLRQVAEVDLTSPSAGTTHPETVLRAWALQQWNDDREAAEGRIEAAFAPSLDLNTLDLPGQDRLLTLTRDVVAAAAGLEALRSPGVTELAEQYGVTAAGATYARVPSSLLPDPLPAETKRYLATVLADLATADDDSGHETLAVVLAFAHRARLGPELLKLLRTELGLGERERQRISDRADALVAGGE